MIHYGVVRNGRIELDPGELSEGVRVRIEIISDDDPAYHLGDDAIDDPSVPTDFAAKHDHYRWPKRNRDE